MAKPNKAAKPPAKPSIKEEQTSKKEQQATPKVSEPQQNDLIVKLLKGKEIYLLLASIAIACFIIFREFISLEKVYLYKDIGSDSLNIFFPSMVQMSEYIKSNGLLTWTFSQGLGQNMFPLFLSDFLSDIITLFSKEQIPYLLVFAEIIKIFLCGFVFFRYLQELKLNKFPSYLGAFLFAFCGYVVLGGCWTIFSLEALYAALILYGFERWLNRQKILWFVLGITFMSFLQPFFLFPYTIFLAVYIPVRYNDIYPDGWKRFPVFLAKTLGLSVLAVAISAFQLFPDLLQYIESPRVGGEAQLITKLKAQPVFGLTEPFLRFTTTFRAFGSDMLGTGSEYKGWQNYLEGPLFYCGILCLVTFTQVFAGIRKGQKIAYGILAGIFVLPILFPFFRFSFWAYTGDYFRTFSLIISLLLLIFTSKALHYIWTKGKINLIVLGVTVACLLFLLYSPSQQFEQGINQGMRSTATLLIFLYAGLLYGLTRPGNLKFTCMAAIAFICFGEIVFFSSTTVNDRDAVTKTDLTDRIGYNDYTVDAIKYIKDRDKSFYRVNKDYSSGLAIHASINDAKVQGYYSSPSYFSFNQKNYIKFLADLNIIDPKDEFATRWARGLEYRPLLLSLISGKYWVSHTPQKQLLDFGYDSLAKFNNVYLYRNKYALPFGVTYDQVLDESSFKKLSNNQKDIYLLKGCVVSTDDNELFGSFRKFNLADTNLPGTLDLYFQSVNALRKDSLNITQFKEKHIKGEISVPSPRI